MKEKRENALILAGLLLGIGHSLILFLCCFGAFILGDWKITLGFNAYNEGLFELILMYPISVLISLIALFIFARRMKYGKINRG